MYQDLYEYLVLHRQLSIPGIGTIQLERKPAGTDITHRQISPPVYSISLDTGSETPTKRLFHWLGERFHIHYHEAIVRFNSFSYDFKQQVLAGNKVDWANVGTFSKGMSGDIRFEPAIKDHRFDPPVSAARMIREKAVHTVRVGEQEKTSVEMSEWLHPEEQRRSFWWAPVLIVAIILVTILSIYISQNGCNPSSAGNQKTVTPLKPDSVYTLLK
ncbi:MAG TPA: hypothetical protein VFI06_11475 [Chitinophagaceae bacterium]|nr:hypothetical protein [Chitinophagaceae bacterium]